MLPAMMLLHSPNLLNHHRLLIPLWLVPLQKTSEATSHAEIPPTAIRLDGLEIIRVRSIKSVLKHMPCLVILPPSLLNIISSHFYGLTSSRMTVPRKLVVSAMAAHTWKVPSPLTKHMLLLSNNMALVFSGVWRLCLILFLLERTPPTPLQKPLPQSSCIRDYRWTFSWLVDISSQTASDYAWTCPPCSSRSSRPPWITPFMGQNDSSYPDFYWIY